MLAGQTYGHMNGGAPCIHYVKSYQAGIVFVTIGAHVHDKEGYHEIIDKVLHNLKEMLKNQTFTNTIFVWKFQQPAGCAKYILVPHDSAIFDF